MNTENQLIEKFQVEELEKRYEFKWVDSARLGIGYEGVEVHVDVAL